MKIPKNSDITKYECFYQFVFKLLNLQMGTYRKILPWNPKLALMCTSPSVNLEKLQINKPKFLCYESQKIINIIAYRNLWFFFRLRRSEMKLFIFFIIIYIIF
jgi:hypothetical protein